MCLSELMTENVNKENTLKQISMFKTIQTILNGKSGTSSGFTQFNEILWGTKKNKTNMSNKQS